MADQSDFKPHPGPPTDLGWMLSCSGVHPEAVRIVEAYQAETKRLRKALEQIAKRPYQGGTSPSQKARLASDDRRTPDSPRWCDHCKAWGDRHTDRCPHRVASDEDDRG